MEHKRDWRSHTDKVSTQEDPFILDYLNDDKSSKHVNIVSPDIFNQKLNEVKETEVAAQITLAPDGGWGWVVLVCAFLGQSVIDGLLYSYGPLLPEICKDLKISESLGALVNSVLVAMVYLMSPISSALINKFGFRAIGMIGSMVCSFAMFGAYFAHNFTTLLICYGLINGFGFSMMSLTMNLVPGFYFEKLRTMALTIVSGGASVGIMTFYPCNNYLVAKGGWRPTILLHSGISGLVYFLSLNFHSLPSIKVTAEATNKDMQVHPVTYLPDMSKNIENSELAPSISEKVLGTVSNAYFPHADDLLEAAAGDNETPGPSERRQSRVEMIVTSGVSPHQMKNIRNHLSIQEDHGIIFQNREVKKGCCGKCCDWETTRDARPLYRDDAFYNSSMRLLKEYRSQNAGASVSDGKKSISLRERAKRSILGTRKSVAEPPPEEETGIQYQLSVMRVATIKDLEEKKLICPTAIRRVLVTMLDPTLLRNVSFVLFCLSGFLLNLGVLVPYLYLQARGIAKGLDPHTCSYLISVVSLANLFGKVVTCLLAMKISSVNLYGVTTLLTGIATLLSGMSYTLLFQIVYSVVFGMCAGAAGCLRPVVIVELCGLENLTGGTGIALMFNGIANVVSTPLAAVIINSLGFEEAFYVSGAFITLAGIVVIPLKIIVLTRRTSINNLNRMSILTIKESPITNR